MSELLKKLGDNLACLVTCQDHTAGEQQEFKPGLDNSRDRVDTKSNDQSDMWGGVCAKDNSSVLGLHN